MSRLGPAAPAPPAGRIDVMTVAARAAAPVARLPRMVTRRLMRRVLVGIAVLQRCTCDTSDGRHAQVRYAMKAAQRGGLVRRGRVLCDSFVRIRCVSCGVLKLDGRLWRWRRATDA